MAVARFIVCFLFLADGARISTRSQLDDGNAPPRVTPTGEDWAENTKYVCMQKWQKGSGFVQSFCLANYEKASVVASDHFEVTKDLTACQSTKFSHKMKLCALKDETPNGRLSYKTKVHVAKACFRYSTEDPLLEAAVDEEACAALAGEEGDFKPKITTTTPTTTPTTTTEELPEVENEDSVVEDDDMAKIDAVCLFTSGDEKLWEYNEKAIKCCVSSKEDNPTELQDMKAEELPKCRTFGSAEGCGMMFCDTYHNGPKREKYNTCPVLPSALKEITGDDFQAVKSSFTIPAKTDRYVLTCNTFEILKKAVPLAFEDAKTKFHWFSKPMTFEPAQDERPEGPELGDMATMDATIPNVGHVKIAEQLLKYTSTDDMYSHTYEVLESTLIKPTKFIGTVEVSKDPENAEQSFVRYEAKWASGAFDQNLVKMFVDFVDS